jgi:TolB protein
MCQGDLASGGATQVTGELEALGATGSPLERWERLMADDTRRRQTRVGLVVVVLAALLLAQALAWQAFVHGVWGVRLGTLHEVLFVGSADDPLDGSVNFVPASRTGQLYAVRPDGTGLRRLTNTATGGYFSPAWSPDGTRLAAFRLVGDGQSAALVLMRADGTGLHVVPSVTLALDNFGVGNGVVIAPMTKLLQWSPDGSQLLAPTSQGSYVLLRADGTQVSTLTGDRPTWAPDGRHVAYFAGVAGDVAMTPPYVPFQMAGAVLEVLDTQTLRSHTLAPIAQMSLGALAWSPDGRYLAATTWREDTAGGQAIGGVMVLRPDGSDQHELIQWAGGEADQLSWSPDGRQLAAMVENSYGLDEVGNVPNDGSAGPTLWVVN